jgi:hypothetical protein
MGFIWPKWQQKKKQNSLERQNSSGLTWIVFRKIGLSVQCTICWKSTSTYPGIKQPFFFGLVDNILNHHLTTPFDTINKKVRGPGYSDKKILILFWNPEEAEYGLLRCFAIGYSFIWIFCTTWMICQHPWLLIL